MEKQQKANGALAQPHGSTPARAAEGPEGAEAAGLRRRELQSRILEAGAEDRMSGGPQRQTAWNGGFSL